MSQELDVLEGTADELMECSWISSSPASSSMTRPLTTLTQHSDPKEKKGRKRGRNKTTKHRLNTGPSQSLDCWIKPENPKGTHTDMGRTCRIHTIPLWPWCEGTVLPHDLDCRTWTKTFLTSHTWNWGSTTQEKPLNCDSLWRCIYLLR